MLARSIANVAVSRLARVYQVKKTEFSSLKSHVIASKELRSRWLTTLIQSSIGVSSGIRYFSTHKHHHETSNPRARHEFHLPETFSESDIHKMISHFTDRHLLDQKSAIHLLSKGKELFKPLPALVDIKASKEVPITVIGDVHGQFYDVLNIFKLNGFPSPTNRYLFNGDLVDRGYWGSEIVFTLLAFKILYPDSVHINAGNHEDDSLCSRYGFRDEVETKYGRNIYTHFMQLFDELPLLSIINNSTLVVHGGLPPGKVSVQSMRQLFKRSTVREESLKSDRKDLLLHKHVTTALLWSDPWDQPDEQYGCRGIPFGPKESEEFLRVNQLDKVIRSHVCVNAGYKKHHDGRVVTLFSAAHYCRSTRNKGAFARFEDDKEPVYTQFGPSFDPYYDSRGQR